MWMALRLPVQTCNTARSIMIPRLDYKQSAMAVTWRQLVRSIACCEIILLIFFFFSSRRRHTRYWRDWSSDVCSSDLNKNGSSPGVWKVQSFLFEYGDLGVNFFFVLSGFLITYLLIKEKEVTGSVHVEIGRASCRERV